MKAEKPFYIFFTDLDGTLLDHDTYEWDAAVPALNLCRKNGFPVVLVSSKTRAEMEPLHRELHLVHPFVCENGGGILFPVPGAMKPPTEALSVPGADDLLQMTLGVPYSKLIVALQEIRNELGLNLKGFSDMKNSEIGLLTGLDPEASRLAAMREYDEPFIILEEQPRDMARVISAANNRDLKVTEGGRFYHLQGENDKGRCLELLMLWYRTVHEGAVSVALGDSPNDFEMLKRADHPILIRSMRDFYTLKEEMPSLLVTQAKGPAGWNQAVINLLKTRRESVNV